MSSHIARFTASTTCCLLGLVMLVLPAGAAEEALILDKGWWWRLQAGVLTTVPAPPDVEPGQLMVQGTPEGAQAIAAIAFELPEGRTAPTLTLTVADGGDQGGEAAELLACQAGSGWSGAEAARWDTAPIADCSQSVTGIRSDDGGSWTFPVASLQFVRRVNVVFVPGTIEGAPEGADGSSFRLIFEEPKPSSITSIDGSPPPTTSPPPPPIITGGGSGFVPPASSNFSEDSTGGFEMAPPVVAAEPSLEPDQQGQTATAPRSQESTRPAVPAASEESRTLARVIGLIVLLGGLAYGFLTWRQGAGGVLAGAGADGSAGAAAVGGLGRFRRERSEEPAPVS